MPELIILDVGHGNCAILQDTDAITIIDCPLVATLFKTLKRLGVSSIDQVLISHADFDHAGGLPALLRETTVHHVYINPDADKKSKAWIELRSELELAEKAGTRVHTSLTSSLSKQIHSGQVEIEILAPSLGVALGGSGGEDLEGRKLTSNAMSVVIGLMYDTHRIALLAGDMDEIGLDNLLKKHRDIEAQILVFPHHGGNSGSKNDKEFAQKLCSLVKPNLVLFSFGRDRFDNPREDIVQGVVSVVPDTHIMCTQLSRKCAVELPNSDFIHLADLPAFGQVSNSCCGGTVSVSMDGRQTTYVPLRALHRGFIDNHVATPLCLKHHTEERT